MTVILLPLLSRLHVGWESFNDVIFAIHLKSSPTIQDCHNTRPCIKVCYLSQIDQF